LKESSKNADGTYNLTGQTGSPRYMAPEVAKCEPYNQSADVYSFAILFWQIMSMKRPFDKFTQKTHEDSVIHKGHRPFCEAKWPKEWTDLMRESWSPCIDSRPNFNKICDTLCTETYKLSMDESLLEPTLDLSVASLKKSKC